jgi:hypothetical protein
MKLSTLSENKDNLWILLSRFSNYDRLYILNKKFFTSSIEEFMEYIKYFPHACNSFKKEVKHFYDLIDCFDYTDELKNELKFEIKKEILSKKGQSIENGLTQTIKNYLHKGIENLILLNYNKIKKVNKKAFSIHNQYLFWTKNEVEKSKERFFNTFGDWKVFHHSNEFGYKNILKNGIDRYPIYFMTNPKTTVYGRYKPRETETIGTIQITVGNFKDTLFIDPESFQINSETLWNKYKELRNLKLGEFNKSGYIFSMKGLNPKVYFKIYEELCAINNIDYDKNFYWCYVNEIIPKEKIDKVYSYSVDGKQGKYTINDWYNEPIKPKNLKHNIPKQNYKQEVYNPTVLDVINSL